jgi:ATP-dependent Lhr-like helicase
MTQTDPAFPRMRLQKTTGYQTIEAWLAAKDRKPFSFQLQSWDHIIQGQSGIVNAPTGYGKTYSVFLGALIQYINEHPTDYKHKKNNGLQLLWVTPLRALAKDIARAMQEVVAELGVQWVVSIRNGDTSTGERAKQKRQMPEVMIITPESLHLLLAQKNYPLTFSTLRIIAVDEWHELLGSKRGVQVELAISRLVAISRASAHTLPGQASNPAPRPSCAVWGISATIGNLTEAKDVLLSPLYDHNAADRDALGIIVKATQTKIIEIESIIPEEIETYPWSGHLGLKLAHRILPVIHQHQTTLIFINTRGMSERWYQQLLITSPELSGALALHHGSIEQELRLWVEDALHQGTLQAVVCTSSLDLGVDFRPVEAVVQVGSPKGVARFTQRAGRSGHQPGASSKIWFLPTHSLELLEAAALKEAIMHHTVESRQPYILCFDVLLQYLCTLAISEGFAADSIFEEIRSTFCFRHITREEFNTLLQFLHTGGNALKEYDEYRKMEFIDGIYKITDRKLAMRHRMHIGTIVSDAMLKVKFLGGAFIGVIEEWFISRLQAGDVFTLAGRNLEFLMIKDMAVLVKKSNSKKSIVPSWMGGRLPLSANLGNIIRKKLSDAAQGQMSPQDTEMLALKPLFQLQQQLSHIPLSQELLIEHIETKDGFHLFVYPFEGRLVHEAMAALLAYRISKTTPITFSVAMNDYGFELLSDQPIPIDDSNAYELFSEDNLLSDIQQAVNATEMTKRKFRDIAVIGGLIFQGMPGEKVKQRHLQSSASLLFQVFSEYDPHNLLLKQAFNEVMEHQMEESRLRQMLQRIRQSQIVIRFPSQLTPFCFPIKVDSMRENISSEKLEDRIIKMQQQLNQAQKK